MNLFRRPTLSLLLLALPLLAETPTPKPTRAPGELQKPGEIRVPTGPWQKPGEIRVPTGPWQKPGEIKAPTGPWQKPGEIRTLKPTPCEVRLIAGSDVLFEFDKATLSGEAEITLKAFGERLRQMGPHPISVEGHTDGIGTAAYNQDLSEKRARAVRDWLAAGSYAPADAPIKGYGKSRPVAPNTKPDGRDDPEARQKNRRVEIRVDTCR